MDPQKRLDELFDKILKEREGFVESYLDSLERLGAKNMEAIGFFGMIADCDRHLQNLTLLGATPDRMPQPLPRN